jgi:hypothetical protein
VSARPLVVGDPFADVPAGHYFNAAAFAPPALGTNITTPVLGNMGGGAGVMRRPRTTNLDATMSKSIPIGERCRVRLQVQAYNVFNHTEYNGVNSTIQFNAAGVVNNAAQAGTFSSTLPARVMAFSARVEF